MNSEELKHLQMVMLKMAKDIKIVCEKNGLNYFLDSGSLLGAVRHGGFIPWDDDFDIGMTRDDFEKFCKVAPKELGDKYFVQTWHSEINYGRPLAKVRLNNTRYIEKKDRYSKINHGIFIDILPYDRASSRNNMKILQKKLTCIRSLIYCKCGYYNERSLPIKIATKTIALFVNKESLVSKYEKLATQYNDTDTPIFYAHTGTAKLCTWMMHENVITKLSEIRFEDTTFSAPKDFDKYLRSAYGDYMVLPDASKRIEGHGVVELNFEIINKEEKL